MDKIEVTQADIDAWETYGPAIFNMMITGPQALAHYRLATRTDATPVAWMPIESAPKDGTTIDVWIDGEFPRRRSDVCWREPTDSEWWVHGGDTLKTPEATWHDCFGPLGSCEQPTHWQPLPAAPDATHPPATDVAALVEAAKAFAEIDLTGSGLPPDFAMNVLAIRHALAPFTKGQNDE